MCCLCQPEVLPDERTFFRKNYPGALVKTKGEIPYFGLQLKKGMGSCVFLNGRRCDVYDHRTQYCRQYPYHLYASDRLKVELDLSCRGAWTGTGADALEEAKGLVQAADKRIVAALEESKEVYREFFANCKEAGVYQDPSMLRMTVSENASMFSDLGYLSRIMDMSTIEPIMAIAGIRPETNLDMASLEEAGRELAMDSMSSSDPLSVPVYCDKDWNWNMFMAANGRIEWSVMDDEGDLQHKAFANAESIKLKVPDADGRKVLI
ncbi:MAG: YkgJ family cysteine cluster protein, partial [Candidatus Methanomethylophilaceae archaeon]|nr:YkgJ family cysteine cluster protein [Candidatus Methanomethylophilaceae archaeon]